MGKREDKTGLSIILDSKKHDRTILTYKGVNNDLKLSYEDLAAMLGKTKSTIRGQINSIKQKSEGVIEEYTEKNGKKRVYIPEETKEKLLKKAKVRVQIDKKGSKRGKIE